MVGVGRHANLTYSELKTQKPQYVEQLQIDLQGDKVNPRMQANQPLAPQSRGDRAGQCAVGKLQLHLKATEFSVEPEADEDKDPMKCVSGSKTTKAASASGDKATSSTSEMADIMKKLVGVVQQLHTEVKELKSEGSRRPRKQPFEGHKERESLQGPKRRLTSTEARNLQAIEGAASLGVSCRGAMATVRTS